MHIVTKNCLAIQFYFIKETLKSERKDHLFFIFFFSIKTCNGGEILNRHLAILGYVSCLSHIQWVQEASQTQRFFLWGCLGHELRNRETTLILVRKPFKDEVINLFQPHHALTTC